jgi:aminocarboxymuconate-semialdehyde decarboxylase
MKIDFHNHFYPPEYLKRLRQWGSGYEFSQEASGLTVVKKNGARFSTITPQHINPEQRMADMDRVGIDIQVLSLSNPNVYFSTRKRNLTLARITNDYFADLCQRYPHRFIGFASVPLDDPEDAIEELHRSAKDLGLKGVVLGSNINGKHLHSKTFWPFYEEVNRLELPIFVHPMVPAYTEPMVEFSLVPLVGFLLDTTLSVGKMVFSGLFEKHPNLCLILPHLGGVLPFLLERMDNGYRAYSECREHIRKLPSEYLKKFYYDTVSFHGPALMCAYYSVGADHMVLGSDYPHVIGDISKSVSSIEDLNIPEEDKLQIFGENARRVLKLP